MNDKRCWFTYAINAPIPQPRYRRCGDTGNPNDMRPEAEVTGVVLVIEGNSEELIHRILGEPFINEIADGVPVWCVPCGTNTVVTPYPTFFSQTVYTTSPHALLAVRAPGYTTQIVKLSDVFAHCFRLERLTNSCGGCGIEHQCVHSNLVTHLSKLDVNPAAFGWPPEANQGWYLDELVENEENLGPYLRKMCKKSPFRYTAPRTTVRHPFSPAFVCVDEVDFSDEWLQATRSRISGAAKQGARTRNALKRCREECYFYAACERVEKFSDGCYYGDPGACQGLSPIALYSSFPAAQTPGPFSEEQIMPAFRRWWEQRTNALSREQIAFIARHAGREIRMWERPLVLGRCTPMLDRVRFYYCQGRGDAADPVLNWDETMTLLHTPVRDNRGGYKRTTPRTPDEMSWEQLSLYAELCQHTDLSGAGILEDQEIVWFHESGGFSVTARHPKRRDYSHKFFVGDLKRVLCLKPRFTVLPEIFRNNVRPLVENG